MSEDRNGLTEWALDCYRQPGVMPSLLALQDEFELDVLLLLTTGWLWSCGRSLPSGQLPRLVAQQLPWQQQIVAPLRQVRRNLKPDVEAQTLYQQVKAVELGAELLQLGRLQKYAEDLSGSQAVALLDQLWALSVAQGGNKADTRLQSLLEQYAAAITCFSSPAV
tara:strand:- start:4894 stop:5388 length:495 start_codon:yes stop_codon:yes gene_type:complete